MFIEVIKADYLDGYRVKLLFNNGETRIVDLSQSLNGSVFAPLKDLEFFKRFTIKFNTIEWSGVRSVIHICQEIFPSHATRQTLTTTEKILN